MVQLHAHASGSSRPSGHPNDPATGYAAEGGSRTCSHPHIAARCVLLARFRSGCGGAALAGPPGSAGEVSSVCGILLASIMVPKWYHDVVAMNLRLDEEDSALRPSFCAVSLRKTFFCTRPCSGPSGAVPGRSRTPAGCARQPPRCWTGGETCSTGLARRERGAPRRGVPQLGGSS